MKILFSNIGYARGISGTLWEHISKFNRHVYCSTSVQRNSLSKLKAIIDAENPDLCCLLEIDQGGFHCDYFQQIYELMDDKYNFHDISDKYGEDNPIKKIPLHIGRSNAFLANVPFPFERLYFKHGTKRLIYKILLPDEISLYFTHFSLRKNIRAKQFREIHQLIQNDPQEVIILGDFNIMNGFSELKPLLQNTDLHLMNMETEYTFTFHIFKGVMDLAICSESIAKSASLRIIPQVFSDHDALLLEI
jgi:endonuclease/exonuclease/phosphatase family metal-dependent hydrolase